ncbi:hypothetical protein DZF91_23185, partial [Actinomadura logoneensis]
TAGAAGAAGGGGLLAATGAKVAAAALATTVIAGGTGTYVATQSGGHHPQPKTLRVTLLSEEKRFPKPDMSATVRYAQVTGLASPAVENRVNALLRQPVEKWADDVHTDYAGFVGPSSPADERFHPANVVELGVKGPRYLSVRYAPTLAARNTTARMTVTVDLTTGAKLATRDILLRSVDTDQGARTLTDLLKRQVPNGAFCGKSSPPEGGAGHLTPDLIENGGVRLLLTSTGAEFHLPMFQLGYDLACNRYDPATKVPYAQLRGTLRPEILKAVTGG